MKHLLFSLFIMLFGISSKAQEAVHTYETASYPQFYSVNIPEKGVLLLHYHILDRSADPYITVVNGSFYDFQLKKVWDKEIIRYSHTKAEILDVMKYSITLPYDEGFFVDPNGAFVFVVDQIKNGSFHRIRLTDGQIDAITIENEHSERHLQLKGGIDAANFYLGKTFYSDKGVKDTHVDFELYQFDLRTLEKSMTKGTSLDHSGTKVGLMTDTRKWLIAGVGVKGLYLLDSYGTQNSDKSYDRKILCYNLSGDLVLEKELAMGDKPLLDTQVGDVLFNPFGLNQMYTISYFRRGNDKMIQYAAYNQNLEQLWIKEYETKIIPGQEEFITPTSVITGFQCGYIHSYETKGHHFMLIQSSGPEYKFIAENPCAESYDLGIDACASKIAFEQYPEIMSYLKQVSTQKSKDRLVSSLYKSGDAIIVVTKPEPNGMMKYKGDHFFRLRKIKI